MKKNDTTGGQHAPTSRRMGDNLMDVRTQQMGDNSMAVGMQRTGDNLRVRGA